MKSDLMAWPNKGAIVSHANSPWQSSQLKTALISATRSVEAYEGSILSAITSFLEATIDTLRMQEGNQAKIDLRLLGNYLRMASQHSEAIKESLKQISWGADAGALDHMCSGEKEATSSVLSFLRGRHLKKRITIFDVGANTGGWSSQVAKETSNTNLHIFEPNSDLSAMLESLVRHSGLDKQGNAIIINMFGIHTFTGFQNLYINGDATEQATLSSAAGLACFEKSISSQRVATIRGDEYCAAKGILDIDYLKLDTEGTEMEALLSFGDIIKKGNIGFIQFEYGKASLSTGAHLSTFFEALEGHFLLARILPEGLLLEEGFRSDLEDFKWANYLAINKRHSEFIMDWPNGKQASQSELRSSAESR
jgi:FkbM family methyltransferase